MPCGKCGEEVKGDHGWQLSYGSLELPVLGLRLCARCGGVLRAWLDGLGELAETGMPGARDGGIGDERGLFEDHAEGEGIKADELRADGRVIGYLPKHPVRTESRTDQEPSPETAAAPSSSPPVASTLYVDRYGRPWS